MNQKSRTIEVRKVGMVDEIAEVEIVEKNRRVVKIWKQLKKQKQTKQEFRTSTKLVVIQKKQKQSRIS